MLPWFVRFGPVTKIMKSLMEWNTLIIEYLLTFCQKNTKIHFLFVLIMSSLFIHPSKRVFILASSLLCLDYIIIIKATA